MDFIKIQYTALRGRAISEHESASPREAVLTLGSRISARLPYGAEIAVPLRLRESPKSLGHFAC